jgi:hypothetical protein
MSRKRRTKYYVQRRLFLNRDPELPAFVIGVVEDTRAAPDEDPQQPWRWGTVELCFGDCYRRVNFDFDLSTQEGRAAGLYKIRRLAEVVGAVREAIELEAASRAARPDPPEAEEKE